MNIDNLYFIAELGQNHQGSLKIAKDMVDSLVGSGVKAVKTAKRALDLLPEEFKSMPYENPHSFGRTYYEHRKALELSHRDFQELKEYAERKGFDFISSFTDFPSLVFLQTIGVSILKIASSRVKDVKLLNQTAEVHPGTVIMSSGMSELEDIDRMVAIFKNNEKYLLQCTATYPCPEEHLNLRVLDTYYERYFDVVDGFGFSGHHSGIAADIGAYLKGAKIIERHFTLNRAWKGTDHAASLGVDGIKYIMKYIKQIDEAMGDANKKILDCELPAIKKLRYDLCI